MKRPDGTYVGSFPLYAARSGRTGGPFHATTSCVPGCTSVALCGTRVCDDPHPWPGPERLCSRCARLAKGLHAADVVADQARLEERLADAGAALRPRGDRPGMEPADAESRIREERDEARREVFRVVRLANERLCAVLDATGASVARFPLIYSSLLPQWWEEGLEP